MSVATAPAAVITGGTGTVGSALIHQVARMLPDHDLFLLTRRPERVRSKGMQAVYANLQLRDLGMDQHVRSELQSRATMVIHCAADTRFALPMEQARLTNTNGTRHILKLALAFPRLRQFAHISTLFVAGRREGVVTEEPLSHAAGYVNTYERAKHEAEHLVLAESGRLPVGIYRLSSVIDESGTGGHFRQVIRFAPWCDQFPFFPAESRLPVDLISSVWAARALGALITEHFTAGCIRHVCAGPAHALPLGTVMELVLRAYELSTGSPVSRPRLIPLSDFRKLSERLPRGSGVSRALTSMMTFIPHLSMDQPFDSRKTAELLYASGVPDPCMSSLLSRVLSGEFCPVAVRA